MSKSQKGQNLENQCQNLEATKISKCQSLENRNLEYRNLEMQISKGSKSREPMSKSRKAQHFGSLSPKSQKGQNRNVEISKGSKSPKS